MTDHEENKLTMIMVVNKFLTKHAADLASHVKIAPAKTELEGIIQTILTKSGYHSVDNTGYRLDKNNDRKALEAATFQCAVAAKAYANENDLATLLRRSGFSMSAWQGMRDAEFYVNARQLYKAAAAVIADLADFRYQPADLNDFEAKLDEYFDAIPTPLDARSKSVKAGKEMDGLFNEADLILDKLDTYMDSFRFDEESLWMTYRASREIVDSRGKKRKKTPRSKELAVSPLKSATLAALPPGTSAEMEVSNLGMANLQLWRTDRKEAVPNTEKLLLSGQTLKTTLPKWKRETQIMARNLDPDKSGKLKFRVKVVE